VIATICEQNATACFCQALRRHSSGKSSSHNKYVDVHLLPSLLVCCLETNSKPAYSTPPPPCLRLTGIILVDANAEEIRSCQRCDFGILIAPLHNVIV
jgi:hypothetical protein